MLGLFGSSDATETDSSSSQSGKGSSSQSGKGSFKSSQKSFKIRNVEVWENQRYQVGVGFNKEGLLPTDRLNFSDKDGTKHFDTLEEATVGLLTPGWRWTMDSQWLVNSLRGNPRDGPGWSYAIDFVNDEENYAKEMNALHYVRRRVYHRQQEYSAAEYKKWLDEDTAKKALQKEQTEKDALLAAAGGQPVTNQFYGAVISPLEDFGRAVYTLPSTVAENTQKQIIDYGVTQVTEMATKEHQDFSQYLNESTGKWHLWAFFAGGTMMATSLVSGLLNMCGLDWMGFSPLTACINLYVFLFGVLTLFLEYKDHPATRDVKNIIRAQLFFLEVPYGRACFYVFVGSLMVSKGNVVDVLIGGCICLLGGIIFTSSFKIGQALTALKAQDYTRDELSALFKQHDIDNNGTLDKGELAALCTSLGTSLTMNELESALMMLDTNGSGSICEEEFVNWWHGSRV